MDKFMYIIEAAAWSEYGGTQLVIAKDDEEVMTLLWDFFKEDFGEDFDVEHFTIIEKFRLSESLDSRIVKDFGMDGITNEITDDGIRHPISMTNFSITPQNKHTQGQRND